MLSPHSPSRYLPKITNLQQVLLECFHQGSKQSYDLATHSSPFPRVTTPLPTLCATCNSVSPFDSLPHPLFSLPSSCLINTLMLSHLAKLRRSLVPARPSLSSPSHACKRPLCKPTSPLPSFRSFLPSSSLSRASLFFKYSTSTLPSDFNDVPPTQLDEELESNDLEPEVSEPGFFAESPSKSNQTSTPPSHSAHKPTSTYERSVPIAHNRQTPSKNVSGATDNTFVSSYYRIDESVFEPYLSRKNLVYKKNANKQFVIRDCPFCHDTKSHPTNLWKLYIYMENGHYHCFRCSSQGSWYAMRTSHLSWLSKISIS